MTSRAFWGLTLGEAPPLSKRTPRMRPQEVVNRGMAKRAELGSAPLLGPARLAGPGRGVLAIPFSPRDAGWLPAHAGNARKPRLTVTSRFWAVGFKTTPSSSGAQLSSCSGSLGSPCWWRQVHSLKQMYSPGGPSGPEPAAEGVNPWQQESRVNQWETKHTHRKPIKHKPQM